MKDQLDGMKGQVAGGGRPCWTEVTIKTADVNTADGPGRGFVIGAALGDSYDIMASKQEKKSTQEWRID